MDAKEVLPRRNQAFFQILTSMFAIASVAYVWITIDSFLDYQASLESTRTVEIFGSEWPVSTINAMVFGGWLMTAGPYAAGVLATQLGLIWLFRPRGLWLACGIMVSLICSFAVVTWASNL